jgi:hypothetical protein
MSNYDTENDSRIEIDTCVFGTRIYKKLGLSEELDGKTLRQILSELYDGREVYTIDIHDGGWHDGAGPQKVLDTEYKHFGPSFIMSNQTSLNMRDLQSSSWITSAGGLRVALRKPKV